MSKSPFLLTDLYQLTMAQGYWKSGLADRHAVFHLFAPADDDIDYLRSLDLFDDEFLRHLRTLRFACDVDAILAAGGTSVLEFGLPRAQGPDGGLSAARAAYIVGVDATSNTRGSAPAIDVGRELRRRGFPLHGIRLDSGDLALR